MEPKLTPTLKETPSLQKRFLSYLFSIPNELCVMLL